MNVSVVRIQFTESLKKHVRRENLQSPINLIFISESCRSIVRLPDICESLVELSKKTGLFEPAAIIFGSDDFCASLGATRTDNSQEILYARQRLVLIAKSYGLQAIDMVHIDFKGTFRWGSPLLLPQIFYSKSSVLLIMKTFRFRCP